MATDLGHARLRRAIVGGGFHPGTNPVQESDPIVLKFDKKKRSPKRMKVHPELEQTVLLPALDGRSSICSILQILRAADAPRSSSSLWLLKVVEDGDLSRAGAQPATAPHFAFISSAALGR
ncbi:hypothetical protein F2Q68_00008614 [Brassica cretica]|uniref:Uncharacterized protein n=1 Tax=Brassica cretica TaxID=69181 RepID=A0A3N6RFN4_BRACR|nr:hypothetical protein F2Q68_00008614 [Brassica cretica]